MILSKRSFIKICRFFTKLPTCGLCKFVQTIDKTMITRIVSFILILYAAFYFGFFFGGILAPWPDEVSGRTFAEYHKAIDFYMGKRMPILVLSGMFFMLVFLVSDRKNWRKASFKLIAFTFVFQIGVIILGINTNVALNPVMNAWNPDQLPANWEAIRDQWLGYHQRNTPLHFIIAITLFLACYFYWTRPKVEGE